MTEDNKQQLFAIVRASLQGARRGAKRRDVEAAILAAHMGRPDGWIVTNDNLHLFRQYRNCVSPDPARMVTDALSCQEVE